MIAVFIKLLIENFAPRTVSIGPFHHGKIELQQMEEHKLRYLRAFLQRINTSFGDYINGLKQLEISLRQSYAEISGFNREEFMEIMAVDGAFVMEMLLKLSELGNNDRIFGRQQLIYDVFEDLFLIENQLPFFFLKHLFQLNIDARFSLKDILEVFVQGNSTGEWSTDDDIIIEDKQVHHLLHFLMICLQQSQTKERRECTSLSISELHRAGVKFRVSSTHCFSGINFADGILEIPKLRLTDKTEKNIRNMQAFEYCHQLEYCVVGDYIFLMDMLINDGEDVKILVQSGIIENWLEDNHAAAAVFNNLGKGNATDPSEFSYTQVVEDLNAYYKRRRHRWKAALKQKYFNNPWTIISVVAAAFLLLLTIIQTICSILQVV